MKLCRKKRKRKEYRKCITVQKSLKFVAANCAGIKSKLKSFDEIITSLKPQVWMLQETKLKTNETIKCDALDEFQIYYLNRQNSHGGGLALGVNKDIESTLIRDGDDQTEVISVQAVFAEIPVRIVVGYGPQENSLLEKKSKFWDFIENEVNEAELEGHGVIIQMDGNLHAGQDLIPFNKTANILSLRSWQTYKFLVKIYISG